MGLKWEWVERNKKEKKTNAPSRDRTYDKLIKSQLLYQLSYRGLFCYFFLISLPPCLASVENRKDITSKWNNRTNLDVIDQSKKFH